MPAERATEELLVNKAQLTGESRLIPMICEAVEGRLIDSPNIAFAGGSIVRGNGTGVVFATGHRTEFGKIAAMSRDVRRPLSPMQGATNRMVRVLTIIAVTMGLVFFACGVASELRGTGAAGQGDPLDVTVARRYSELFEWPFAILHATRRHFPFDLKNRREAGVWSDNQESLYATKGAWESLRTRIGFVRQTETAVMRSSLRSASRGRTRGICEHAIIQHVCVGQQYPRNCSVSHGRDPPGYTCTNSYSNSLDRSILAPICCQPSGWARNRLRRTR